MGINYSAIAKNASKAIRKVGAPITWTYKTAVVKDPVKGTVTGGETISESAYAVLDNINKFAQDTFGVNNIQAEDMVMYIEANAGSNGPPNNSKINGGSQLFTVIACKPIAPANLPVLFIAQVRR